MRHAPDVRWGRLRSSYVLRYGFSLAAVGAAVLLTHFLPALHATPTVLFFAAVATVAWMAGRGPAVLAIALSSVVVDFFLVPPLFSLLNSLADLVRLFAFALIALLICYFQDNYQKIAIQLREANDVLEARVQQRTADLATANQSLQREIQERQRVEEALRESEASLRVALASAETSLREKEVLFRELQHRVKNNLQIITSLLSLQGSRIQDAGCKELFKECQHRVRAIALIHQRLCGASNLAHIDLAVYFQQLVQELARSYFVGTGSVRPRVTVDETALDIDHLVPCALIVNELVCNSFKYAFPLGQSGEVCVEVHRQGSQVSLTVADDGVGFSPGEASRRSGAGLQIVQALVEQLRGKLQWTNGRGTSATITFAPTN